MREYFLGQFAGLRWTARPSAFAGWALVWVTLALIGLFAFGWALTIAVVSGLIATVAFVLSAGWHQIGHAIAARSTGYPMTGVRYWGVLDSSIYPENEPALPPAIHIRRALGGPIASLLLSAVAGSWVLLAGAGSSPAARLAQFVLLLNFVAYTLQVFLPLSFNDGSTLLRWLPKLIRGEK
jgi:hypothetical protein